MEVKFSGSRSRLPFFDRACSRSPECRLDEEIPRIKKMFEILINGFKKFPPQVITIPWEVGVYDIC